MMDKILIKTMKYYTYQYFSVVQDVKQQEVSLKNIRALSNKEEGCYEQHFHSFAYANIPQNYMDMWHKSFGKTAYNIILIRHKLKYACIIQWHTLQYLIAMKIAIRNIDESHKHNIEWKNAGTKETWKTGKINFWCCKSG